MSDSNYIKGYEAQIEYLRAQLAEKEAALAVCLDALTYYANNRDIYSGEGLWLLADQAAERALASLPESAKDKP